MAEPYTVRLTRRTEAWWAPPRQLYKWSNLVDAGTRYRQRRVLMSRNDPLNQWRKGKFWHRRLNNKWNAREFAAMHDVRVPHLYWSGRNPGSIPFDRLPKNYVIRGAWSAAARDVYVMRDGHDLLRDRALAQDDIVKALKRNRERPWPFPILIEEFLADPLTAGDLPIAHKIHMFNGVVGVIDVIRGNAHNSKGFEANHYTSEWENVTPSTRTKDKFVLCDFEPPASLDEMINSAQRMSRTCGNYMRMDFYSTNRGCVFGEFASIPSEGRRWSEFGEHFLGELWARHCENEI